MKPITAQDFELATGQPPEQDDLERVNCPHAGEDGHEHCGWCYFHNTPQFVCSCFIHIKYGIEIHPRNWSHARWKSIMHGEHYNLKPENFKLGN